MGSHHDSGIGLYPSQFGRGWIPAERDIGLPGEGIASGGEGVAADGCDHSRVPLHRAPHGLPPRDGEECEPGVRHDGWTAVRKVRFLDCLAGEGNVRAACAAVAMSPEAAYRLRRRDAAFARAWMTALMLAQAHAEQVLADRALNGVREPVFHRGEQVGERVKFDNRLLLAHLARLDRAAEGWAAAGATEPFDEMLAIVAGERPDADMLAGELQPMTREAYAGKAQHDAETEAYWERHEAEQRAERCAEKGLEPGDVDYGSGGGEWGEDEWDADERGGGEGERSVDPVLAAGRDARAAAEAAWDAWRARGRAAVDRALGEDPAGIEFKSLDPVTVVNFAPARGNFAAFRPVRPAAIWTR